MTDLPQRLDDTILWMELRSFICSESQGERFQLERIWPDGTVPRQQEVAELLQRTRRLQSLVRNLLERADTSRINLAYTVALATKLGVEVPQSILEKL